MKKHTCVCKVTEADVASVAVDVSMEITISQLRKTCVGKCIEETLRGLDRNDHVTKRECLDPCEIWGKVPNTDAGSLDDRRNTFQLIQIIVRLRPVRAKAVLEGRGQGGLFARETIIDGHEPETKGMLVWADSKWTLEKRQVEMQLVKGVNGFIYRLRTAGQVPRPSERGESENATQRCEVHESRHIQELQQWRFGPLPYIMQPAGI